MSTEHPVEGEAREVCVCGHDVSRHWGAYCSPPREHECRDCSCQSFAAVPVEREHEVSDAEIERAARSLAGGMDEDKYPGEWAKEKDRARRALAAARGTSPEREGEGE